MKIAVPTNDGHSMAEHFGQSSEFLVFGVKDGQIENCERRVNTGCHADGYCSIENASGPDVHAEMAASLQGCDIVLCLGMGKRAAEALKAGGISPITVAAVGPARAIVSFYLSGKLKPETVEFSHCGH
jgi:predicted Fe-Mo cluster-binding NifX family protein